MRALSGLLAVSWSVVAFALSAGCSSADDGVSSAEGDLTSCEGAALDAHGVCRKNGRYAKKICCEGPSTPTTRRSLEAYTCPSAPAAEGIPVAFFDADSTLRVSKSGSVTAASAEDVNVLPFAAEYIKDLNAQGYLVAVVSNQGGVASGATPYEVAEGALVFTLSQLAKLGGKVDYLDFADQKDEFRKPNTGMPEHLDGLLEAACGVGVDWGQSFMIGDAGYKQNVDGPHPDGRPADDFSNSDRLMAENVGIPFTEPTDAFGWREFETYNIHSQAELVELLDAMEAEAEHIGQSEPERALTLFEVAEKNRQVNGL
jgi:D-glycero-D-manno-heptose 1,7-bisphosphate phosphatase